MPPWLGRRTTDWRCPRRYQPTPRLLPKPKCERPCCPRKRAKRRSRPCRLGEYQWSRAGDDCSKEVVTVPRARAIVASFSRDVTLVGVLVVGLCAVATAAIRAIVFTACPRGGTARQSWHDRGKITGVTGVPGDLAMVGRLANGGCGSRSSVLCQLGNDTGGRRSADTHAALSRASHRPGIPNIHD